jgi:hypothetical protein
MKEWFETQILLKEKKSRNDSTKQNLQLNIYIDFQKVSRKIYLRNGLKCIFQF